MNEYGSPDFAPIGGLSPETADAPFPPTSTPVRTPNPAPTPDMVTAATHAELAAIVLGSQPLGAVLRRVAELAVRTISGADEASVTLIEHGRPRTVSFSGQLAATLDERQYEAGFGPCMDAAASGQTILLDVEQDAIYPSFARQARRHGIRQVLSVGMPTLQRTSGGLNFYGFGTKGAFSPQSHEAAVSFAGYAAVTLFNAALYAGAIDEVAQMKQALATRAGIEQAKGIVMGQQHCTAEEAFAVLVDTSSRSNRKLRDVAQEIVEQATSG